MVNADTFPPFLKTWGCPSNSGMKESLVIPPSKAVEPAACDAAAGDPGFASEPECCFEDTNCLELNYRGPKELGLQVEV